MYANLTPESAEERFGKQWLNSALAAVSSAGLRFQPATHQVLLAAAMRHMECNRRAQRSASGNGYFEHSMAVVPQSVGTGKTLVCAMLAKAFPEVERHPLRKFVTRANFEDRLLDKLKTLRHFLFGYVTPLNVAKYALGTLVLIKSTLKQQWVETLRDQAGFPAEDVVVFDSSKFDDEHVNRLRSLATDTKPETHDRHPVERDDEEGVQESEAMDVDDDGECCEPERRPAAERRRVVVVMTELAFTTFRRHDAFNEFCFQRTIVDESDSFKTPLFRLPATHFAYFVTASPENLHLNNARTSNLNLSTFVFNSSLFSNLEPTNQRCWKDIQVSCAPEFVASHIQLPPTITVTVYFKRRALHTALQNAVNTNVFEALAAGDVRGAVARIKCRQVEDDDCLVRVVTEDLQRQIQNLRTEAAELRAQAEKQEVEARLLNQPLSLVQVRRNEQKNKDAADMIAIEIPKLHEKIENIKSRVLDDPTCKITLDEVRHPVVTPCCKVKFELAAIIRVLDVKKCCPWCNAELREHQLIHKTTPGDDPSKPLSFMEQRKREEEENEARGAEDNPYTSFENAVKETVRKIFREDPGAKILIFSNHDMRVVQAYVQAALERHGEAAALDGNHLRVNKLLNEFREGERRMTKSTKRAHSASASASASASTSASTSAGSTPAPPPVRVLMLNAQRFGQGLNIQAATHVITMHELPPPLECQVIGRAQRWGRHAPLKVVHVRMTSNEDEN